jgi:hypothetical protein
MMEAVMSFTSDGRKVLPRERFALVLRRALANHKAPAKFLARLTGRTPKAATNWLSADNDMNLESLIEVCRHFDEAWDELKSLCGRANTEGEAEQLLAEITTRLRERRQA